MHDEIRDFILITLTERMNLPIDRSSVTDESLLGPGGLDLESLAMVELVVNLENEFKVSIPEEELVDVAGFTLGKLVRYIQTRVGSTVVQ